MSMRLNLTRSPSANSICLWQDHIKLGCGRWLQTRCCELVSTRLNLLRSAFAYLCAGKKELIELGVLWTVVLDLEIELREGEREWGVGPPLECGAFSLQQFAELQASVARSACSNSRTF